MGDRSRIIIISKEFASPIHLYGHWSGETNFEAVEQVLAMPENRVGDPSYLTAQLFHAFGELSGYTGQLGFGISMGAYDDQDDGFDDNPQIVIDADTGETYGEIPKDFASAKAEPAKDNFIEEHFKIISVM
jgi:hypothetical protein